MSSAKDGNGCWGGGGRGLTRAPGQGRRFDRPRSRSTWQDKDTERAGSPAGRFPRIDSDSSQTPPEPPRKPPLIPERTRPCSFPDLAPETRTRRVSIASIHGKLDRALLCSRASPLSIPFLFSHPVPPWTPCTHPRVFRHQPSRGPLPARLGPMAASPHSRRSGGLPRPSPFR